MSQLSNNIAIVTGASSGIGYARAKLFAREGAKVVVAARRQAELDRLVAEIEAIGGRAIALAGDVKDERFARALVEIAIDRFGGLDIAFNNAGILGEMGPTPDVSLSGWRETIETNLTSAFLGAKYQIPAMLHRGGGSIIHFHIRRLHSRHAGHGGLCRRQGGSDRPGQGAGCRVRPKSHQGERNPARRH